MREIYSILCELARVPAVQCFLRFLKTKPFSVSSG